MTTNADGVVEPAPVVIIDGMVICPHCGEHDRIVEIDVSYRANKGHFTVINDMIVSVSWSTGEPSYDHDSYQCGACGEDVLVSLIDDKDQEWI